MPMLAWRARRFDPVFIGTYESLIPAGGVVVDIGAHRGLLAWIAARRAREILAFEPNPDNFRFLKRLQGPGFRCFPVALSDAPGRAAFAVSHNREGVELSESGTLMSGSAVGDDTARHFEVDVSTLDSFDLPDVDFIKLDVEGAEHLVLAGARATIERCRPAMFVEVNADETGTDYLQAVVDGLAESGYRCRVLGPEGLFEYADFDLERHQIVPRRAGDMRRYANNFLFTAPPA